MKLTALFLSAVIAAIAGFAHESAALGLLTAAACGLLLLIAATDYRGPRYARVRAAAMVSRRETMALAA